MDKEFYKRLLVLNLILTTDNKKFEDHDPAYVVEKFKRVFNCDDQYFDNALWPGNKYKYISILSKWEESLKELK
jgi:hypothetical protein